VFSSNHSPGINCAQVSFNPSGLVRTRMMNVQFFWCRVAGNNLVTLAFVTPSTGNQFLKELLYFDICRFEFYRML
jgi:hypothetical protein